MGKGNWGNLQWEDEPWQDRYKSWVDEVAKIYGGLDILAIDMLHTVDGRDICLELNDTAPGLYYQYSADRKKPFNSLTLAPNFIALRNFNIWITTSNEQIKVIIIIIFIISSSSRSRRSSRSSIIIIIGHTLYGCNLLPPYFYGL